MLVERLGRFDHLRLASDRIVHQRRIDELVASRVHAEDRLQRGGDRQREERAERAEQRAEREHGQERDRLVDVHRTAGDNRREQQVLDLLVHDDEHEHRDRIHPSTVAPREQDGQRAADIRADSRDELGDDAAEQGERQPVGHVEHFKENRRARRVDQRENRTGEQERRDLILRDRPHEQEALLHARRHPLAEGATELRPRGGDVVGSHHHGEQLQQEREQAADRADRGAGEITHPRGLEVLEQIGFHELGTETVHVGDLDRELGDDERADLLVGGGDAVDHGNHLLEEHAAEQGEQHADDERHREQAGKGGETALPAVPHQRDDHRLNGERQEERDDDIEHQIGDLAPRARAEIEHDDGDGHVEQRTAEPFRRFAGIALRREQGAEVPTLFGILCCGMVTHALIHGSPL